MSRKPRKIKSQWVWKLPASGQIKVNVDGSFSLVRKFGVIRQCIGKCWHFEKGYLWREIVVGFVS